METTLRSETSVRFESFELNLRTGELYRNGLRLKVRGHPVDVLAILLEHPGELVTRETLRKRLWPDNTLVDFEQILNNSVGKLREALGDQADSPRFIETLPRLGYRFIAPVKKSATTKQAPETPNETVPDPSDSDLHPVAPLASHSGLNLITKRWIVWPVAGLAVTFAASGFWYVHTPLPAPRITHYEQLTLDGRQKFPRGTDGARVYMQLRIWQGIAQVPVSGGKITEIPIELPRGAGSRLVLAKMSPDGSRLLIASEYNLEEGYKFWEVGTVGRPARYLTRAYSGAWSPDGRTFLYIDAHGDIYTMSAAGGEARLLYREDAPAGQVTSTGYLAWSPDGKKLRFNRGGGTIFEISSTGANLHEWLPGWNGGMKKCCGRWTPDGHFFVFLAGSTLVKGPTFWPVAQIWAVDERNGGMRPRIAEPVQLTSGPILWGDPVPSRDGKKIFARGVLYRGELVRYDATSKRLEPYLGGISAEMLDFSRDGKYVAYVSFPDGILWRANRDGSGVVQLTEPPFYPRNPRWSPDGTQILFTDNMQRGVDSTFVISSQGGTAKRVLPEDAGPQSHADWSPDGTRVVYTTDGKFSFLPVRSSNIETRIIELATGTVMTLPMRPGGFTSSSWSPDGRYIAGRSLNTRDLLNSDLKTGNWKTLFQEYDVGSPQWSEHVGDPIWSHDGRFLYFVSRSQHKAGVYRVAIGGGKAELVIDLPEGFRGAGWYGWYGFWMSLDPDDMPLMFRDVGTDEIYALTLESN